MKLPFVLSGRTIDRRSRPFVIAEIAQAHDGSLGNALAFIEVARECGADAVKFQTHLASEESTTQEPWRIPFSRQDASRHEYWRRMEFTRAQWTLLKQRADECGIIFLSSPFSVMACEWLAGIGMAAWKIASGEVHNDQLLAWIESRREPVILSSGLSTVPQTVAVANRLRASGCPVAVLHCTTKYPTPPEEVSLNVMSELAQSLDDCCPVGLSDHSGTIFAAIGAITQGAAIIEVHLAWHRRMFGPDTVASVTPSELAELVRGVEFAWRMRESRPDKATQLAALTKERAIFGRSLVAARDIKAGETFAEADLGYKKPGGGMIFEERHQILGKRAARAISKDEFVHLHDVI